jgi:hypothetical protein
MIFTSVATLLAAYASLVSSAAVPRDGPCTTVHSGYLSANATGMSLLLQSSDQMFIIRTRRNIPILYLELEQAAHVHRHWEQAPQGRIPSTFLIFSPLRTAKSTFKACPTTTSDDDFYGGECRTSPESQARITHTIWL